MDNDWSPEARLEVMLLPGEVLVIPFVFLIEDSLKVLLLSNLVLVLGVFFLQLSSVLSLELEVEADRELEVALDGAALVWAL